MATPVIKTKLFVPPLRPTHIPRSRLLRLLETNFKQGDVFGRKLTLVSAPAGFGKTTLAVEWLQTAGHTVTWYSLDEGDNDPVRFLTYVVAALRQVRPEIGEQLVQMLQSPQLPPPEALLAGLLNELSGVDSPFVLAVDDYHLIQTAAIHQQLNFLIEHLPPKIHLVLMTREDPPLLLHRLRASGEALEIRQGDIRFTTEEMTAFLKHSTPLEIEAQEIKEIEQRTEGWVTGMQLVALSLQKHPDARQFVRSFVESERYILDYLFEEVFKQQSEEVQQFLIRSAALERLSAPLCEAVTGSADSGEILDTLDQADLFIVSLDPAHTWFRYHRLFLELLRQRLRQDAGISWQELHQKAQQWYQENNLPEDAMHHALAGEDWGAAAGIIGQTAGDLMKQGRLSTLLDWFKRIPEEVTAGHFQLGLAYSWPLVLTGQVDEAESVLAQAEKNAPDDPSVQGEIAALAAFIAQARGDQPRLVEMSERALSMLPDGDRSPRGILGMNLGIAYWHQGKMEDTQRVLEDALAAGRQTGNRYLELTARLFQSRTLAVQGRLKHAAAILKQIAGQKAQVPIMSLVFLDLSSLHYEWNQLDPADEYLAGCMAVLESSRNPEFQIAAYLHQARLRLARGDQVGALGSLEAAHQVEIEQQATPRIRSRSAAYRVEIALALKDIERAEYWAGQIENPSGAHNFYRHLDLTEALLLLAKGQGAAAGERLEKARTQAEQAGWEYGQIAVGVLQALAAPDPESGLDYLGAALRQAQAEGYVRTFVDAGPGLAPLLTQAVQRGIAPVYAGELLAALDSAPAASQSQLPDDIESLSERELEVLRLVAAGLSNRQIAEQLVVSVSTVKSHVHHICAKLNAENRTQAAARAREFGLL